MSVGILWGRPGTRTCGISVGLAEGLRRVTQPGQSETWDSNFRGQIRGYARVVGQQLTARAPVLT